MTHSQKARISQMRLGGDSYATIGDALGLSRNTVKSYCLRNLRPETLEVQAAPALTGTCAQCGSSFTICPGHRQRRFCSYHCRMTWWNAHRDSLDSKGLVEHTCASCGKHFMSYDRQRRRYCSHACYIAYRYRKELSSHE